MRRRPPQPPDRIRHCWPRPWWITCDACGQDFKLERFWRRSPADPLELRRAAPQALPFIEGVNICKSCADRVPPQAQLQKRSLLKAHENIIIAAPIRPTVTRGNVARWVEHIEAARSEKAKRDRQEMLNRIKGCPPPPSFNPGVRTS